ncbi:E3 ubiquitin-protein ligase TRIM33-like [Dreissena polymorpha]|uniref:RING-type domain-containing protein n=1 Tax=Dreissena polymorpha TaxID=45954 RepID=A0A9D4IGB2_DREPO|nr:E3 ubiquitin-protein ligase TRIM33-like [Dreissena polymorpha]KAH3774351.1 hypothetical protein DPMN_175731 [Dreissena polymorpha]
MPTRSVRSSSRASTKGKSGPKKPETCSQCDKADKNLRLLECSHALCPACLKSANPDAPPGTASKDGRASKMSTRGGRKSAAPTPLPVDVKCPVCTKSQPSEYGECAPCKFENKTSGAAGYCVECGDLLCELCCTEHNKFKTIRAHHILRGDKIPRDTGAVARLPLLMMCMTHTDKDLEYYCGDHDVMACGACVNTDHRRCDRVMFIKDITDEPTDRKTVADAAVELRDIRRNFEDIHKDTGEILSNLEQQRNEIRERRDHFRNRINALLDKLDSSSELEMEQVIQGMTKDMGEDSQSSKEILSEIDSSIQILDAAASHATTQQMFVAGRRSIADRNKYMNMLNSTMGSIQNVQLDFKPDPTLERLAKSLELFEGRTITSNSTRQNQRLKNSFQPQNGFADHVNGQTVNNLRRDRPSSNYGGMSMQHTPQQDGLASRQSSLISGSVPDFRSANFNGMSDRMSMTDYNGGMLSVPQSPRRHEFENHFQTRSMPPTPRQAEINRLSIGRANTGGLEPTYYERQMYQQGALPMISPRGAVSEPGNFPGGQPRDFAPTTPRTIGRNGLIEQGLVQPQPKADVMAINQGNQSRRGSLASTASMPVPAQGPSKAGKSDILAQAPPVKRRNELQPGATALRDRKAVLAGQFNVRLPEDSNVCGLKGAVFLADGRIVMADYDNHNVKMFDSKLYRGSQLRLSSGPWDVEVTGPKEIAVSLPFESKIQFISVTDQMKTTRAIKMDMDCYGLVCRNQELIVVCNDYLIGPAVQVVSLTGRVKQTIDTDRSGRRILTDPYYLTVTPTGKLIYVSDKDRIVCMDRHGNVTSVYQDQALRNARGVDIDNEGNLYVCGYMSNTVHQITMHGIDFRCLIDKEELWDPWSVKFNESNGTILVTCDNCDTIKVFTLQ